VKSLGWVVRAVIVAGCLLVLLHGPLLDRVDWAWVDAIDTALAYQCHRIPARTLVVFGTPMSICSRCAGLYLGIALAGLTGWPRWSSTRTFWVAIPTLATIAIEVAIEGLGWMRPAHSARVALAMLFSWPITAAALRLISSNQPTRQRGSRDPCAHAPSSCIGP
jgi:hypothetical protein